MLVGLNIIGRARSRSVAAGSAMGLPLIGLLFELKSMRGLRICDEALWALVVLFLIAGRWRAASGASSSEESLDELESDVLSLSEDFLLTGTSTSCVSERTIITYKRLK